MRANVDASQEERVICEERVDVAIAQAVKHLDERRSFRTGGSDYFHAAIAVNVALPPEGAGGDGPVSVRQRVIIGRHGALLRAKCMGRVLSHLLDCFRLAAALCGERITHRSDRRIKADRVMADGRIKEVSLDLNSPVQPNDTIKIPQRIF